MMQRQMDLASSADASQPTLESRASVVRLLVDGMDCSSCARKVTAALQSVPGVDTVEVALESGRVRVAWSGGVERNSDALLAAVRRAGYAVREEPSEDSSQAQPAVSPADRWRFNVVFGSILSIPLLLGEWVFRVGDQPWFHWVGFAMAAPVMAVCGRGFAVGAWRQLRRGASNMDTLVTLGAGTAFGFSLWALLAGWPGHLYFMEAAAIVTLISAGHWLEARASSQAAGALRRLMDLAPARTLRVRVDGSTEEVDVASLRPEDRVALRPGDRVPTDGEVVEGESAVDEAMLTGESMPVEKQCGGKLHAGTLNLNGRLTMRVTATGDATALAQIIEVVRRAQNSRAGIQRLADRISNVFVPVVVGLALLTALWWGLAFDAATALSDRWFGFLPVLHRPETAVAAAFVHAAAVLIVACPCAMGLATPVAIMAGTNAAARRGILIRDGEALEKSGRITAVAFDKTGTLTRGMVGVTAEWKAGMGDPEPGDAVSLPSMVLGLAGSSFHPLSRAMVAWASTRMRDGKPVEPLAVYGWQEIRGRGVEATYAGDTLRLGSVDWLESAGVDVSPGFDFRARWAAEGAAVLGVTRESVLLALFAARDQLKESAGAVVGRLSARGLHVYLITGDSRQAAAAVADPLGLPPDRVLPEVRPERKAQVIEELQQRGERVAFVGDGINDAPALEQADLGIAVSRASDVAREAADVILLNTEIAVIPEAIGLAQATLRTIRQNLFWAFFYNVAAIPLAALGHLSPVICALAMGASDLVVIGNALRLSRWQDR